MAYPDLLVEEDQCDQDVQDPLADEMGRPLVGRLLAQRVGVLGVEVGATPGREAGLVLDDLGMAVKLQPLWRKNKEINSTPLRQIKIALFQDFIVISTVRDVKVVLFFYPCQF